MGEEKKMQKNRFSRRPKPPKLTYGDFGLITLNEGRIEFVQLGKIRRTVKKFVRKKQSAVDSVREKTWYFGSPNFLIQKKSKNSRMGKGKGMIDRKVIRIRRGVVLFEFVGVSYYKLIKLTKRINKFLSVRFIVLCKNLFKYHLWFKGDRYAYYYDRYLLR